MKSIRLACCFLLAALCSNAQESQPSESGTFQVIATSVVPGDLKYDVDTQTTETVEVTLGNISPEFAKPKASTFPLYLQGPPLADGTPAPKKIMAMVTIPAAAKSTVVLLGKTIAGGEIQTPFTAKVVALPKDQKAQNFVIMNLSSHLGAFVNNKEITQVQAGQTGTQAYPPPMTPSKIRIAAKTHEGEAILYNSEQILSPRGKGIALIYDKQSTEESPGKIAAALLIKYAPPAITGG
jgi:hypothetical protein